MKKNRFFPVCLSVALVFCAFGTLFAVKGWVRPITETVAFLTAPLRYACHRAADGLLWLGGRIFG